jgi:HEAT repeat protein
MILRGIGIFLFVAGCGKRDVGSAISDLSSSDHKVRLRASYELIKHGPVAVEPLIDFATTGPDSLRYISAQILGRIGDERARGTVRQLAEDRNEHVRRAALLALGNMADPGIVEYLVVVLREETLPDLRAAAAQSLGASDDTLVVPALVHALQDTASSVRKQAVAALHRLWTQQAESAVTRTLTEDPEDVVRFVAAQTLGQHRTVAAREPLRAALRDTSVWVRAEAARSLGMLGDAAVIEDLAGLLEQRGGPDADAAREALQILTSANKETLTRVRGAEATDREADAGQRVEE